MSEVNPPGFLQNAGAVNTAEILREAFNSLIAGTASSAISWRSRGGVHPSHGGAYAVTQNGSPNMSVNVATGVAWVPGSEVPKQAVYNCFSDTIVNKTIAASDPSLPRIDIVVLKVQDSFYSGGTNSWSIAVVTGTAAGSPAVPTAPANSIILAQIAVAAGATTIVTGNITDRRIFLSAVGGLLAVTSKAERDALFSLYSGYPVWRADLNVINVYTGSEWRWFARPTVASTAASETTTSTSYVDLTTVGPQVVIETGTTVELTMCASMLNSVSGQNFFSVAVSGATTLAASDSNGLFKPIGPSSVERPSITVPLTGLTAGVNTFTMKYKVGTGTGTFADRRMHVRPT